MKPHGTAKAPSRHASPLLVALEQTHEVKARVEACAEDLGVIHELATRNIDGEDSSVVVFQALATTAKVKDEVQRCAEDLSEVNETIIQGITDLKQVEVALSRSRKALAESTAALTESKEEESMAQQRALHDSLTQLPNRELFEDRLTHGISLAERHQWVLVVMFLDLNSFKSINDTLGHAVGDVVITEVARRLAQQSRDEDTVCRIGGDEFLYLVVNPPSRETIEHIADRVARSIAQPIVIGGRQLIVRPSIGIALYPESGTTGEQLIQNADMAMYHARRNKMDWCFFDTFAEQKTA